MRTWGNQFNGFDLKLEEAELSKLGFNDTSWGNDICPSFERGSLRVWINYLDPNLRDLDWGKRYALVLNLDDGNELDVAVSDDFQEIIKSIKEQGGYCPNCGVELKYEDEPKICSYCEAHEERGER